ncbi:MAG: FIG01200241: hypothetical protein [uncultured Sulfurovum sp.]|uniref:PA14 domain-containing protein n=1 Tax=uncultured Sulfurovum sp. TaxID=269237 RepID=A0A6S6T9A7_9BACT|nr:MAG: FIG01200241: hypothetical protein [uncultured Sulfurovum sp.]
MKKLQNSLTILLVAMIFSQVVYAIESDFNGDGTYDILVKNTNNGRVNAWLNSESGTTNHYLQTLSSQLEIVNIADVNGDGQSDIILQNKENSRVNAWISTVGKSTTQYLKTLSLGMKIVAIADINGDGKDDLVIENSNNGRVNAWLSTGGKSTTKYLKTLSTDVKIVDKADINGDGKDDLVIQNINNRRVNAWLSTDEKSTTKYLKTLSSVVEIARVADINGDGKDDLVVQNKENFRVNAWLSTEGTSSNQYLKTLSSDLEMMDKGDIDGDAKDDLIVKNKNNGRVSAWISTDGESNNRYLKTLSEGLKIAKVGDVNADNTSDIIVENTTNGRISAWLNSDEGTHNQYLKTLGEGVVIVGSEDAPKMPVVETSLEAYLLKMQFGIANDNLWTSPKEENQVQVRAIIGDLLAKKYLEAQSKAKILNGDVIQILDANKTYYVLHLELEFLEDEKYRAVGGTYVIYPEGKNSVIEVPHPSFDSKTNLQGVETFIALESRFLLLSGTHRNSSTLESTCQVSYQASDASHNEAHYFHQVHKVLSEWNSKTLFIQLHGFGSSTRETLWSQCDEGENVKLLNLSEGVDDLDSTSFMHLFHQEITANSDIKSCVYSPSNDMNSSDIYTSSLGGTTNTQGRLTNEVESNVCATSAVNASHRFLHLEQSYEVRNTEREVIIDALKVAQNQYDDIDIAHKYGKATQGTDSSYQYYSPASNVIDNNDSTSNHTRGGSNGENWLQIELPSETMVSKIVLQNRSHAYRLTNAKVYLSNTPYTGTVDEDNLIETLLASTTEQVLTLATPKSGKYLLVKGEVRDENDRHIHLKKLEVYGTLSATPIFKTMQEDYFIAEASSNGTLVHHIEAEDFQGDSLIYAIVGEVPFTIDSDGNIMVNGVLDYGIYTFDVVISDGEHNRTMTLNVQANQEGSPENIAHKFGIATQSSDSSYYYYQSPMNAIDNNLSTFNVTADNGWLQVALPKGTEVSKVVIRNRTDAHQGRMSGTKVYLGTKEFNGTIIPSDEIGTLTSSTAPQIFIFDSLKNADYLLLQEDNDNLNVLEAEVYGITPATPVLSQKMYVFGLEPYSSVGTVVAKINALDYQNDNLDYEILGTVPFSIDNNGTLRLRELIDHNSVQSYDFRVNVSDGDTNTTAEVSVKLLNANGVNVERWNGISGTAVSDLLNDAHYQDEADEKRILTRFDYNENVSNSFGEQFTAILKPNESGKYLFAIVGDDATQLNLNGEIIASRTNWSSYQNWNAAGKSEIIELEAGNLYSLEAFLKEHSGNEHVSVGWKKVEDEDFTLISSEELYVNTLDAQSVQPIFKDHQRKYLIEGTTDIDTLITRIEAYDLQGDTLSYRIDANVPFAINSDGELRVSGILGLLTYTFEIEVSDGVNTIRTSITVNLTSATVIEDVLVSGDVVTTPVTEEELIQATLDEIESFKTFMLNTKVEIFNLKEDGTAKDNDSSLTDISWDPTQDASLFNSTKGVNFPLLYTNAVSNESKKVYEKEIAIVGQKDAGRYLVFGGNPLRVIGNEQMEQVLENALAWLTQRADLKTEAFNVVIAHLDESYWFKDESKTREWLDNHYTGQVSYNPENSCDGVELTGCLANTPDLLIISQLSSENDDVQAIANRVNEALMNGIPVLYIHNDGNHKLLGQALFSEVFDVVYQWDNYWKRLMLDGYNPTVELSELSEYLIELKTMFTHFKNKDYTFDWTECTDGKKNFGTQYDKCDEVVGLASEFQEGATIVKNIFNAFDTSKQNIFLVNNYRLQKLLTLTADKFRQSVSYPMDKVNTDDTVFMKSYYADHAVYNYRAINPVQVDMGNFSRSDFSHITPITKIVNLISKKSFRSTGAYALPGQTVKVTRNDDADVTVKVRINTLRSGATHEYEVNGYKRPKYLTTPYFELIQGETISFTSPYGGTLQLSFDTNELPVEVTFENVGEHPYWASSVDNASFAQKLEANEYDWAEIATSGFEVHSKLDKMIESVNDEKWGTGEALAQGVYDYTSNYPHVLAGFKGEGVDVVPEIHDWANERNITIETIDKMKHMNADQATCGYGCSGNPYDAYWAFDPIGHGDIHEMGHSLQKMRFAGFENHTATNTFSYYTKSKYFDITGKEPSCQGLPFQSLFNTIQASVGESNVTDYLQKNLWNVAGLGERYLLKIQAMMHAQKLGKLGNGWHVLARVHILEREMNRAKQDWEARKDSVGFSTYSLDEINVIDNNDSLIVWYSYASELDLRNYFDMMGVTYSQKAREQIATFSFDVAPNALFVSTSDGYCKTDEYGTIFDRPTLPIDGVSVYPY